MKKWYLSKTLWTNFIGFVAIVIQVATNKELLPMELQAQILIFINFILRLITKEEIK